MGRAFRTAGLGAVVLLVLAGAAGCTPAQDKLVAVRLDGGRIVLDPGRCPNERTSRAYLAVYAKGGAADAQPEQQWSADADGSADQPAAVAVAAPPTGWRVSGTAPAEVRPDRRYYVSIDNVHDGNLLHTGVLDVDGAVLAGLAPDQVVASKGGVMTAEAYRAKVGKSCG
ncbi:hypothetical protein ACFW1A_27935 [Kitasatospora sp. NPDC058965]|uniref:hypothetical protein n=1 Tax=Kitasatospora sp. NPDC058965 TaxID=3346682 RepID=UPI003679A206